MKFAKYALLILSFFSSTYLAAQMQISNAYCQELETFEKNSEYTAVFDKNSNPSLKSIQRDVGIYKELSYAQRLIRFAFMGFEVVIVNQSTMPKMYGFIEKVCNDHNIAVPTVLMALDDNFFNAAAQKLMTSTGAIVIGATLIRQTHDEELEAIIAHELGHIKYNHVNKIIGASIVSNLIGVAVSAYLAEKNNVPISVQKSIPLIAFLAPSFIIGKKFEKQADEFACKAVGKAEGLASFFEHLEQREQKYDSEFGRTKDLIAANKKSIGFFDYAALNGRYYLTKGFHNVEKAYRWLYHNTPFGPHPSHEERIAAAREFFTQHAE